YVEKKVDLSQVLISDARIACERLSANCANVIPPLSNLEGGKKKSGGLFTRSHSVIASPNFFIASMTGVFSTTVIWPKSPQNCFFCSSAVSYLVSCANSLAILLAVK